MRRYILTALVGVVLFLVFSSAAEAQNVSASLDAGGSSPEPWTGKLVDAVFQILIPVLSAFAMWAAHRLIGVVEKKTGIQVSSSHEALIEKYVAQGIIWAEEKSRNKIKEKAEKLSGKEKLDAAANFVMGLVESQNLAGWTKDRVMSKIESKLGADRANGGKKRLDAEDSPDLPTSES